jgi:hypothetical protein
MNIKDISDSSIINCVGFTISFQLFCNQKKKKKKKKNYPAPTAWEALAPMDWKIRATIKSGVVLTKPHETVAMT